MSRVEELEEQVRALDPTELQSFREWFAEFDGELWDRQIESDVASGRLDALADQALR